jgi:Ser/Thr protein kinase RdoA (MazF antagonist)
MPVDELVAYAKAAFGWAGEIVVSAGSRGALGQMWRVEVGSARYALKELFDEPPTEASIAIELDFARRATEAGVRVPASHADLDGGYLVTAPGGTWLRCYDWIDLHPLARAAPETPRRIGALLALLHRCAAPATVEPNGGDPPDHWYDRVPVAADWVDVSTSAAPWVARLHGRLPSLPRLCAAVRPAEPAQLLLCHRDLHWENVHVDSTGALVVVDWDDMGPAEPGQELARVVFDWCCDDTFTDLDAARVMVQSYLSEGGPGRITEPADFSMLLASRLNFLLSQAQLALDPKTPRLHKEWAERELDVALHILPNERQLTDVLAVARDVNSRMA